jgi:uncharacterized membrane protein
MRFPLRRAMTVLALLGLALAAYLTIVHYAGLRPACTAGQACIKVQTSQWSMLDGVPVALIGLIGYILILGALLAPDREETRVAVLGLTMVGFGFSAYLTYRELFSIHAICEECATSAVFMTILLICAVCRYLTTNDDIEPIPEAAALPPRGTAGQRADRDQPRRRSPTV